MSSAGASSPGLSGLEGYASASVPRQISSDKAKVSTDTHSLMVPCIWTASGGERPSEPASTAEQRGRPPARSSATPGPVPVPVPTPSRYSRRRLQRSGSGRGLALPARGSGLPSAGLRASPGCFKASPAGRRGLGRSRLASPGPPPAKPPPAPCPGRGTGRGRAPPPSPASRAPARGQIPLGGTLRARGSPMWLSESGGGGGTGVGGGVPRSCGIGPSLDLFSGSAVRLSAKEAWKKVLRRFGASRNVKSAPQARALPPLNKYTSRVTCPGN